ncbi:MAG: radical SAM protein [Kiritimatiellae bacterium]|jgi:radical SAM protein with 4Fe4S-binding SPASM domain|nr:radical SAM protein [Kiritimatiellia bacterium]
MSSRRCPLKQVDFDHAPFLLIWEVTRSCELACRHCRASAIHFRDPLELDREESFRLIDDTAAMGTPLIVFTGGDPFQREDLEDLIRHAKSRGLRVGTIPATTERLTRERLVSVKAAGVDQLAISIDGATEAEHDDFRRVPGSFAKAMQGAAWVRELDIPLQINTVFGKWNQHRFDALASLVESLGPVFWEVFMLVPTGRGAELEGCSAEEMEELFAKINRLQARVPYRIKITEGQHYRRFLAQRPEGPPPRQPPRPVHAGGGFCFVDHRGNVCPSGFLPMICGNVRETPASEIYRHHSTFKALRDTARLRGKCARCEFIDTCGGGSRSRAYALTGDLTAPDPACVYEPEISEVLV